MRLQEIRQKRGVEQLDLALKVGTNAPMMSNFEHYKCLPIPSMLQAICEALQCERSEIYSDSEIYLPEKKKSVVVKTCGRLEPDVYKLSVRLPERARTVLTQENLEKCGYHSLKDFVWHCFIAFESLLKLHEEQKTTKQRNCSVADESGNIPTQRTISIDHLSIKIKN